MNRKIFTLLAVTCLLFSTAFYVNARFVADRSIGELVRTLPGGMSKGMYHLQVDSIYLPDAIPSGWYPVTYDGGINAYLYYSQPSFALMAVNNPAWGCDTIVLAVTEQGEARMVSMTDLRRQWKAEKANMYDLQSTFWCINVQDKEQRPQLPTFHFTNKIFNMDLDFARVGTTYVSGTGKGWMYSYSYDNNMLNNKQPLYRHVTNASNVPTGYYRVIVAELGVAGWAPTGKIKTVEVPIDQFLAGNVPGMLKFSVVKISPFVLNETEFNTYLGHKDGTDLVQLQFDPNPKQDNPFNMSLKAHESNNPLAAQLGYLNIETFNASKVSQGFIVNSNLSKTDDTQKYNNDMSIQYLKLRSVKRTAVQRIYDDVDYNHSYRFVYFPSEDSLVINAYYVKHDTHAEYISKSFIDDADQPLGDAYQHDAPGVNYFYGLYNDKIHYALIVRYQDLTGTGGANSIMTVGRHPSNTRIYFGINNCAAMQIDSWVPAKGVYTIWDQRGRALGIRIYNGSYTPQWLELEEFECPDRIPSLQWVVEPADGGNMPYRVDITNREFGDLTLESLELVQMKNVRITRAYSKIFKGYAQFWYSPLLPTYINGGTYNPITEGYVKGEYLPVMKSPSNCDIGKVQGYSGFRPVINEYLGDAHLGYKHFTVGQDPDLPSFGKSEDIGNRKGMDYNAFAFNYYNYIRSENNYIHLGKLYDEQILKVSDDGAKTGFELQLGKYLRDHQFAEEIYGYPREEWFNLKIADVVPYYNPNYTQLYVPVLNRYYYEMQVADFYKYRDGLAKQFVVLKGGRDDGSDYRNAMKYGVEDISSEKHPFKLSNIYIRDTYFVPNSTFKTPKTNVEFAPQDPTRVIFHALLDRIELEQIARVTSFGLEVSDTLKRRDGSTPYNLVTLDVDYASSWIKARGKTASAVNVALFSLEIANYDLYRRLRSIHDDNATTVGEGTAAQNLDGPKVLRFYRDQEPSVYLFEDAIGAFANNSAINFLGYSNKDENKEILAPDGTIKFNYNFFVDTAYIRRGTGPIKPQYLLAMNPQIVPEQTVCYPNECGDLLYASTQPFIRARYLVNATDSARQIGSDGSENAPYRDKRYIMDSDWDRLAFVDAIHVHDRLYIVSELNKYLKPSDYEIKTCDGMTFIDGAALYRATLPGGKLWGTERCWHDSKMLGVYYDFGNWENYHNDVSFSFRFVSAPVFNADANGLDKSNNFEKRFKIESETTNRTPFGNRKIAPTQGGWIMWQNLVPVISRRSYGDAIQQGDVFNVDNQIDVWDGLATQNELVGKVNVVAGEGFVTIANAAGKQVTITNILGQTLVNKALAGNNEAVPVAKGVAVVTVQGEKAVKVIIK